MKGFFTSNLQHGAVTPFDTEALSDQDRLSIASVTKKFEKNNQWESHTKVNGWPFPFSEVSEYFEWLWKYEPSFQGGVLFLALGRTAERPQAGAYILPGIDTTAEAAFLTQHDVRPLTIERPLILYGSPEFRLEAEIGQHRLKELGEAVTEFFSRFAFWFSVAFLTRKRRQPISDGQHRFRGL